MATYGNVNNTWRLTKPSGNVNGTWRNMQTSYGNVNGVWRPTYNSQVAIIQGGRNTSENPIIYDTAKSDTHEGVAGMNTNYSDRLSFYAYEGALGRFRTTNPINLSLYSQIVLDWSASVINGSYGTPKFEMIIGDGNYSGVVKKTLSEGQSFGRVTETITIGSTGLSTNYIGFTLDSHRDWDVSMWIWSLILLA